MQNPSYSTTSGEDTGNCQQSPRKDKQKGIVCSDHSQKMSCRDCCVHCVSCQLVSLICKTACKMVSFLTGQGHDHFISLNSTSCSFRNVSLLVFILIIPIFIIWRYKDLYLYFYALHNFKWLFWLGFICLTKIKIAVNILLPLTQDININFLLTAFRQR